MDSPNQKIAKKLASYRAQRDREKFLEKGKQALRNIFFTHRDASETKQEERNEAEEKLLPEEDTTDIQSVTSEPEDTINCCTLTDIIYYLLWFVLWATLYGIFIKLQFGMVYLVSSALIFICLNTRTKPKGAGEVSAYSVFNKNCKSIDGTLTAEQFERELRYGRPVLHV